MLLAEPADPNEQLEKQETGTGIYNQRSNARKTWGEVQQSIVRMISWSFSHDQLNTPPPMVVHNRIC